MPAPDSPPAAKPPVTGRLQALILEYGQAALWVYLSIFAVVLVGFGLAIQFGVRVQSAAGVAGTWGAAYVATKLTQPLRIAATLVLTPIVVRFLPRKKPPQGAPPRDAPGADG